MLCHGFSVAHKYDIKRPVHYCGRRSSPHRGKGEVIWKSNCNFRMILNTEYEFVCTYNTLWFRAYGTTAWMEMYSLSFILKSPCVNDHCISRFAITILLFSTCIPPIISACIKLPHPASRRCILMRWSEMRLPHKTKTTLLLSKPITFFKVE